MAAAIPYIYRSCARTQWLVFVSADFPSSSGSELVNDLAPLPMIEVLVWYQIKTVKNAFTSASQLTKLCIPMHAGKIQKPLPVELFWLFLCLSIPTTSNQIIYSLIILALDENKLRDFSWQTLNPRVTSMSQFTTMSFKISSNIFYTSTKQITCRIPKYF